MKKIIDVIKELELVDGEFYKLKDFEKKLNEIEEEEFEIEDGGLWLDILYINNKIYELYQFELVINIVEEPDFNKFLLEHFSWKKNIEDIPKKSIELYKECYIEIQKDRKVISKKRIQRYIEYIMNSVEIQKDMTEVFGSFTEDKLYFAMY